MKHKYLLTEDFGQMWNFEKKNMKTNYDSRLLKGPIEPLW